MRILLITSVVVAALLMTGGAVTAGQITEYGVHPAKEQEALTKEEADEIRRRRLNEQLWLEGVYTAEALASTVGNMFSKTKHQYPSEPLAITLAEQEERREREQRVKMEKIRAAFTARALSMNAKMEGSQ